MRHAIPTALLAALAFVTSGCARHLTPPALADAMTRAVYAGDAAAARSKFIEALRPSVTPQSVSVVSARMHRYGEYHRLSQVSEIPAQRRYDFEAEFDRGTMLIQLKLASDGSISAYRVVPNE